MKIKKHKTDNPMDNFLEKVPANDPFFMKLKTY